MNNKIKDKLHTTFNIDRLGNSLFYSWQYSLRFELSTGNNYVTMFFSAYDRVRKLLEYTFNNSDKLYVLVRFYVDISNSKKTSKQMRRLKRCGFKLPEKNLCEKAFYSYLIEDKEEEYYDEYLLPIEINNDNYLAILWAVCSQDLGIQPSAEISCYFLDFNRQIIAHPYDDRGMDIVATKKESLEFLYQDYYHWLLDYDLELMQTKFK